MTTRPPPPATHIAAVLRTVLDELVREALVHSIRRSPIGTRQVVEVDV